MRISIFVYGTLKRSAAGNTHRLLGPAQFVARGSVRGSLYDLGRYPGLLRANPAGNRVAGELYEIPEDAADRVLHALDEYEGDEFKRERAYVTLASGRRRAAWLYVLRHQPPKTARHLEGGRYLPRRGAA